MLRNQRMAERVSQPSQAGRRGILAQLLRDNLKDRQILFMQTYTIMLIILKNLIRFISLLTADFTGQIISGKHSIPVTAVMLLLNFIQHSEIHLRILFSVLAVCRITALLFIRVQLPGIKHSAVMDSVHR